LLLVRLCATPGDFGDIILNCFDLPAFNVEVQQDDLPFRFGAISTAGPGLSDVSLKVYNAAGQMVSVLRQGRVNPGSYTTAWNGCDQKGRRLAAGVYVCTLDGPGTRITRKVVLTE
jgi:hypothetical protein